jgi:hypothetical protein
LSSSQSRARQFALVSVSWVVNVLLGDDEQRALGIDLLADLGDVRAVDVGDEVHVHAGASSRAQRLGDHHRAEVGAADADVDHVGDRLPVWPSHSPLRTRSVNARIFASTALTAGITSSPSTWMGRFERLRSATCSTARPSVELLGTREHLLAPALDVLLRGEREQQLRGLVGDAVLRVVDEDAARLAGHLGEALRVLREQVPHVDLLHRRLVLGQCFPGR